jgi:hypothetical protein
MEERDGEWSSQERLNVPHLTPVLDSGCPVLVLT